MELELSRTGFSADGLATLALLTAMIETLPIGEQRTVLTRAAALVPGGSGPRRNEARRMISAMLAQI
jgi:hypothetical protein